ncbi:hypothetical protein CDAR_622881 [Caerostris darwini]|uniref:Uncharacterized protein n=1 Tax=Caerostris darwini TaxID=1538125 RepID=A0AAV4WJW3_9ARAC|nr:hypothetical protein CDAR_622881 [Caerostris darwini]
MHKICVKLPLITKPAERDTRFNSAAEATRPYGIALSEFCVAGAALRERDFPLLHSCFSPPPATRQRIGPFCRFAAHTGVCLQVGAHTPL